MYRGWHHGLQEFQVFLQVLNSHHASIKVKSVIDKQAIDFLDTTVYKGHDFHITGQLDFKVFFKETDTHALLHHRSYQPRHTFRGIVLAQLIRFKSICSQDNSFQEAKQILFKVLQRRGYSRSLLRAIYKEHCESSINPVAQSPQSDAVRGPCDFHILIGYCRPGRTNQGQLHTDFGRHRGRGRFFAFGYAANIGQA